MYAAAPMYTIAQAAPEVHFLKKGARLVSPYMRQCAVLQVNPPAL